MGQCGSKKANTNTGGVGTVKPNLLENTKQDPTKVETVPNAVVEIKEEAQVEDTMVEVEVETTEVNLEEKVNIDDAECVDGQVEKDIREEKDQCCADEACCEEAEEEAEEEVKKEQESSATLIMMHGEKGEEDGVQEQDEVEEALSTSIFKDEGMVVSAPLVIEAFSDNAPLQPEIKSNGTPLSKESKTMNQIHELDDDESIPASTFCNLCAVVKKEESSGNIQM